MHLTILRNKTIYNASKGGSAARLTILINKTTYNASKGGSGAFNKINKQDHA
jgi:hypothetical protein